MNKKFIYRSATALVAATVISSASADVIFTTLEDWTAVAAASNDANNPQGRIVTAVTTPDFDGSSTNGIGNATPGSAGTPGSVMLNTGTGDNASNFDEVKLGITGNTTLLNAFRLNPTISVDYTNPTTPTTGTYYNLIVELIFDSNFFGLNSVSTVDHGTYFTNTYDFSSAINGYDAYVAGGGTINYLIFGVTAATDYANSIVSIDNVQTVPEPSTYAMFGLGGLALFAVARKRRQTLL